MKKIAIIAAIFILAVAAFAFDWGGAKNYDKLAQCLTEKGAVMYGTYWCSHCKAQKADFGDSFSYVNYVECTEETEKCIAEGIEGFPTWIIGGKKYEGTQPLKRLADLTGCELPEE